MAKTATMTKQRVPILRGLVRASADGPGAARNITRYWATPKAIAKI